MFQNVLECELYFWQMYSRNKGLTWFLLYLLITGFEFWEYHKLVAQLDEISLTI